MFASCLGAQPAASLNRSIVRFSATQASSPDLQRSCNRAIVRFNLSCPAYTRHKKSCKKVAEINDCSLLLPRSSYTQAVFGPSGRDYSEQLFGFGAGHPFEPRLLDINQATLYLQPEGMRTIVRFNSSGPTAPVPEKKFIFYLTYRQ